MNKPFAVTSPSEPLPARLPARLQRTEGASRLRFKLVAGETRLERLFQSGAAKVRLPNVAAAEPPQAILINSAGGLTGGDQIALSVEMAADTQAVVTTQACERIYRSLSGEAEVAAALTLAEGARLDWLPQETILFDGGRLKRRLDADLAPGATLLIVEAVIFGRAAHGETIASGLFRDRWRIRRDGRLIFADDLRFDWADAALLHRPAVLAGRSEMATALLLSAQAERHLDSLRALLGGWGAASAWDGKLLARIVGESGVALRRILLAVLELLGGGAVPKVWRT